MMNYQTQPKPRRLRFSVDDYYKLIEQGILKDYENAEIIEGELIQKMPIGDKHAYIVDVLAEAFFKSKPENTRIRIQNPLRLSDYNEPEPDIVLADLTKFDGKRHPRPEETLLIVEVSDTTLKYDRDTKLALYAEAEIPEVWIVNIPNEIIEIHQKPASGIYQLTQIFKHGERVKSEVLPNLEIEVDKILG